MTSKEDILFALAEEGLQFLRAHCAAAPDAESPLDQVRTALWHFYTFSQEHPEYFSLIFIDAAVPRISRDWERFTFVRELRHEIEQGIQQCIEDGVFPKSESAAAILRILWTAMYGAAVFRLSHRLVPGEDAGALAHDLLETTITGLQAGPVRRFVPVSDTRTMNLER